MLRTRYRRIVFYFARVVLSLLWWDVILRRFGFRRLSRRTREKRLKRIAESYRALAIQMGGVLIKMGQFLSARVDVLPQVVTDELAGLQDEVPAEDFDEIRRLAEAELGAPLSQRFAHFEEEPLAAASLGQVHRASMKTTPTPVSASGDNEQEEPIVEVVVKVQRPNIEQIIRTDLAALRTVGKWLKRYRPISRRADVPALLDEFARILYEEIDYLAEGRNAETFYANFEGRPDVRVPRVIWPHTTQRVLTLEDVYAIKITDYEAITVAGVDRAQVARRLFDTYLEQIFNHEFFHADPHPGNLFVEVPPDGDAADWRLTFVDFGMVGRIPSNTRAGLREGVIAIGTQDAKRVVQAYLLMGMLLPHADLELLEQAEAAAFDRFWGKSMSELADIGFDEMHEFAKEFRELIYDMPFQVPQDLILLGRCLAILSGMCTGLDSQFNLWESTMPFAQELLAEEVTGGWEFWRDEAIDLVKTTIFLPKRLERVLERVERGKLDVRVPELTGHLRRVEAGMRRMVSALIFAALLMGGVQLYLADRYSASGILFGGAFLSLVWVLLTRPRRR
ncbi:MAG: AarF/ABC1/UbiB kinase family protein [Anaerolineales bacterium]|nr:AarF/ABC1/UbiB kinase family protein [Anaerolineales bacterium]